MARGRGKRRKVSKLAFGSQDFETPHRFPNDPPLALSVKRRSESSRVLLSFSLGEILSGSLYARFVILLFALFGGESKSPAH
jgi:hypothetical protein